MEIINPFIHIDQSWCPNCGKNSIALVNMQGRLINYPSIIEKNNLNELNRILNMTEIKCMRCTNCCTNYMIDWTGELPRPMLNLTPALSIL